MVSETEILKHLSTYEEFSCPNAFFRGLLHFHDLTGQTMPQNSRFGGVTDFPNKPRKPRIGVFVTKITVIFIKKGLISATRSDRNDKTDTTLLFGPRFLT